MRYFTFRRTSPIVLAFLTFLAACQNGQQTSGTTEALSNGATAVLFERTEGEGSTLTPESVHIFHQRMFIAANDSLLVDTKSMGQPQFFSNQDKYQRGPKRPEFLAEVFGKINETDSAVVTVLADSLFRGQRPPYLSPNDSIRMEIAVVEVLPNTGRLQQVMNTYQVRHQIAMTEKAEAISEEQIAEVEAFLKQKGIDAQRSENGVFYVIEGEATGQKANPGDSVKLHYVFYDLEGKKQYFDSKMNGRQQPLQMLVGVPARYEIGAFQEVAPLLSEGQRLTAYIPSGMAFTYAGVPNLGIEPFQNVKIVFEAAEVRSTPTGKQEYAQYQARQEAFEAQKEIDDQKINAYIDEQGMSGFTKTEGGVYYKVNQAGAGPAPTPGDRVAVLYYGTVLDGRMFDASSKHENKPFEFVIGAQGGVIQGWQEAVSQLDEGDQATVLIPSHMAYGPNGRGGVIGENEVLRFDLKLVDANVNDDQTPDYDAEILKPNLKEAPEAAAPTPADEKSK